MSRTRFTGVLLWLLVSSLITACGGNVFVPLPAALPTAPAPGQTAGVTERLGAVATSATAGAPDLAPLAAGAADVLTRPTPDFGRTAQMLNDALSGAQLLSDQQRTRGNKLYEALRAGSEAIFVLQTARCTFDSARGFLVYNDGSHTELNTRDVQSNIRGQLQEIYFRVADGGLNVDTSPGGGPAQVQVQSDGTVAFGWQSQTDIGTEQIFGLVGDDQMALNYEMNATTVIYGNRAGRIDSGRLLCPMTWLDQADWPPLPPYNIQIESTAQRCLAVSWQPNPSGPRPAKYIVVRQLSDDSSLREVATVTTNYYQDCSQEAISEWSCAYYQIIAVSRTNRRSSLSEASYIQLIDRMLPSWGN